MDRIIVVTIDKYADYDMLERAEQWSAALACPVEMSSEKLRELQESSSSNQSLIIVVGKEQTRVMLDGKQYFFHPNLAKLRVQNLLRGQSDRFIEAAGLREGSRLLDCTLGLGADATVASHVTGTQGCVVGLESEPVLALLIKEGLATYKGIKGNRLNPELQRALVEAMRRISVKSTDALAYLANLEDNSFDVVYFDPMFRQTKQASSAMDLLRMLGSSQPVTHDLLAQALRVASQRVVLKERQGSNVFGELGITKISGGKYSAVAYGIIDK